MHNAYWGLLRSPFVHRRPAHVSFHEGEVQAEALARLRYLVQQQRRAGLVLGGRGCGKSLLLRRFADDCRTQGDCVVQVSLDSASARETLWQIASQLAINPLLTDDAPRLLRRLGDWAAAAALNSSRAVLLADDAETAGPELMRQMTRLTRLSEQSSSSLTLVLACRDDAVGRLGENLLDAIDLRVELEPWEESDTVAYVQLALFEAGCERPVFEEHALAVLHTLSAGVPRDVNRLADYALLGGASSGCQTIDAGIVEAAYDALKATAPACALP